MNPKLRSLLARVILIGGVAGAATIVGKSAPHDQSIAIRLGALQVSRVEGVISRDGDSEPSAGFSQDFPGASPRVVRHAFSAPNGTYTVVINLRLRPDPAAKVAETVLPAQVGARAPTDNETAGARAPTDNETAGTAAPTNNETETRSPPKGGVGGADPLSSETSFERRVTLADGEVTVSPD